MSTMMRMMANVRHHSESQTRYRARQRNMKVIIKEHKKGRVIVPMAASNRLNVQRGGGMLRTHHDPDKNYGSLSSHKRWAAIQQNKPSKLAQVEKGMARLRRAFNIDA